MESKQSKRALIVEDDPDWQETIKELLEEVGCDVKVAKTLVEAKDILNVSSLDLVVADINLTPQVTGNVDGQRLVQYIEDTGRFIPVIFVSGTLPMEEINLPGKVINFWRKQAFDPELFIKDVHHALDIGLNAV